MSSQILQPTRGLEVINSNYAQIPFPQAMVSGACDFHHSDQMRDASADFTETGVSVGDIVYFTDITGNRMAATVVELVDSNTLKLNDLIGDYLVAPCPYTIYSGSLNSGCILYVGIPGALAGTTAAGSEIIITNAQGFIPIQMKVVRSDSSAAHIVAFW